MPAIFSLDARGLRKFEQALEKLRKEAVPYAIRQALNDSAFYARREWTERQMPKVLTLRNKFTQRSVRVDKAKGVDIDHMEATVGSLTEYMDEVEFGQTQQKTGKHGVAIPTASAAGQAKSARPRKRPIQRANYMQAIHLDSRASSARGSRQRRNMVALILAAKGSGAAFIDLGGKRKALFRVQGFTKKGKFRVRMLYDLSRPTVKSPPKPTLAPTLAAIAPTLPLLHRTALEKEFARQMARRTMR